MKKKSNNREYINFDPHKGWPVGEGLYYECLLCGKELSTTEDSFCMCYNLLVDASAGRIGAKHEDKVRLFRFVDDDKNLRA